MKRRSIAYLLFAFGIFLLGVHTTFAVLWQLMTGSPETYPLSGTAFLYFAQGFTPILGAVCLWMAGLIIEKSEMTE
jgi:hypothetical protein